jgi:hypothetical protein
MESSSGVGADNFAPRPRGQITYGTRLPDGAILDLVDAGDRDALSVLSWDGKEILIRPLMNRGGIVYQPPRLHPSIRQAMRFPSGASGYGTILELFTRVASACGEHLGLPEDYSAFATCWILSTWVPELLQIPPTLCIRGGFMQVCTALRMVGALCRRALLVAELSRQLPFFLCPTLLVNGPRLKNEDQRAFWRAANFGLFIAGTKNTVRSLRCTKAVVLQGDESPQAWGPEAMFLILPQAELPPVNDAQLADIAAEFQPKLEMFRLRLLSGADPFVPPSHPLAKFQLARNLGACVPQDTEVVRLLTSLMELHQQDLSAQRFCDPWMAILQAIWTPSHEQREMSVGEITDRVNALLQSLGDIYEYNSKEIGWKLRNLQLSTSSNGKRKILRFSDENRRRIHQCFREWGLELPFFDNCVNCKELQTNEQKPVA